MTNLKINILVLLLLYGCSTLVYKAIANKDLNEITATPDRFLPYCEKVVKDDGTVAFGFMILFLDEEKTVGTATGMLTSQSACSEWKNEVQRIMDKGQSVILTGFGNMKEPRIVEKFSHTFVKHGTFYGTGRSFDFFSIRNNLGQCFSTYRSKCP
jgi:hypothetical protein